MGIFSEKLKEIEAMQVESAVISTPTALCVEEYVKAKKVPKLSIGYTTVHIKSEAEHMTTVIDIIDAEDSWDGEVVEVLTLPSFKGPYAVAYQMAITEMQIVSTKFRKLVSDIKSCAINYDYSEEAMRAICELVEGHNKAYREGLKEDLNNQ